MRKLIILTSLLLLSVTMIAQVTITGVVTSSDDGTPLPGASVIITGTTSGTATDINGRYSITVPNTNVTLQFASIGYESVDIALAGRTRLDVELGISRELLEEVVVMGYSNKSKNEIASAVTVVSSEKLLDVTSPNIGDMLQGKVAGVSVVKDSGQPGAEPTVRIRGVSSMNAPQGPLYVVDGIIGGTYDPNDVESITVMKDAGATGLYGAQANGGVIVITTKQAKTNTPVYNFKASVGVNIPDFDRQKQMNAEQLRHYYREYFRDPETGLVDNVLFNQTLPVSVLKNDTDWRGLIFKPAMVQNYHLSVSGRTDRHNYYSSITYYDENGTLKSTNYKRLTVRSNNVFNLTKWLKLSSNINIYGQADKRADDLLVYYVRQGVVFDSPYDKDGKIRPFATATDLYTRYPINPLLGFESDKLVNKDKTFGLDWSVSVDVKITPWLSFVSQNRISASTWRSHRHKAADIEYMHAGDELEENQSFDFGVITTNMLKFDHNFSGHTLSGLLGYEAQMDQSDDMNAGGKGLPYGLYSLDVVSNSQYVSGAPSKTVMQSFIGQINYNYAERYFLTASFRADQSSTFNKNNRTALFPSASVSWLISNENFMKNAKAITNLKIKASWGKTGMKDIGASKYLEAFKYSSWYENNSAAVPSQMANPNLKWEQTSQTNIGLELGLYNRVNLDLNWYYNVTNDLLVYRDLAPSGGFASQWQNMGSAVNTGFEAAINVTPVLSRDWRWDVDFSIAYNKNWLKGFDSPIFKSNYSGVSQIYTNDMPMYTWYLKEYAGVDPQTGKPQYIDANGNKTFDYASARFTDKAGSALAPWQGGLSTALKWKNFTLSATGSFLWGNMLYGRKRASSLALFVENSLLPSNEDSIWRKPGDNATICAPAYAPAEISSTADLVRGDYFKLRNVTLSYKLPEKLLGGRSLVLSLSCENVCTATTVWGADPEVGSTSGLYGTIQGLDERYPNKRSFVLQANFTF